MKKRNDIKKEVKKIKKIEDSKVNKRRNQSEPDLWKEIRTNLKPLKKAYTKFQWKRKIANEKEERIRLKEQAEERLREEEALKLQEQEERRFKKEKRIKEEKERKLKAQEKQRLEEKRIIEEGNERIRKEQIYREKLIRGEQERIKLLKRVGESREEERKLREERILKIESKSVEKQRLKEEEQRLKEEEIINLKETTRSVDELDKKRLNGSVKWFNDAKGYGFIKREDKEKDVYVHSSAVQNSGLKYIEKGEQLTFEVEHLDKGPSALNLQKTVNEVLPPHLKLVK